LRKTKIAVPLANRICQMQRNRPILGPVSSLEELHSIIGQLRNDHPGRLFLFRGQRVKFPEVRSALSRTGATYHPDLERGLGTFACSILGAQPTTLESFLLRNAVVQHYGLGTHFVDLTEAPAVAAWFASHRGVEKPLIFGGVWFRRLEQIRYEPSTSGEGYVLVFAIPSQKSLRAKRKLFKLSDLSPFLRPKRQEAWMFYDRPPLLPDLNDFLVATISINPNQIDCGLECEHLFPTPDQDVGYRQLILRTPFAELPARLSDSPNAARYQIPFAMPVLRIPEYVVPGALDSHNHKWSDIVLAEARPMREWRDVESFPDILGRYGTSITKATKITVSPGALRKLYHPGRKRLKLTWPRFGSDNLFFTDAQIGHDKVIEIEYPFYGVWLRRDKDLIFADPVSADREDIGILKGWAFQLIGNRLHREDYPEADETVRPIECMKLVKSILGLSALIEANELVVLPHPIVRDKWVYVLEA
jgi:FRG domain